MSTNPIISPLYLIKGLRLLFQPGIRPYVIIPLLINITLFILLIIVSIDQINHIVNTYITDLPTWLQWIEWIVWPLLFGFIMVAASFFSLMVANFIAAPFNSFLAEAILRQLNPHQTIPDSHWTDALKSMAPSLLSEIRKISYFLLRAIPLLLLFIIPGINLIAPLLWLLFSAWVLALEYLEYPMATQGLFFNDIRQQLGQQRLSTLSFGAGILFLTAIPILNFFIMPIAVAGATAMYAERLKKQVFIKSSD